jgi:penicillin amidase
MRHLLTLIVFASLSIGNLTGEGGNEAPSADALARAVTIYRDTYGTPHVFGKSDASTVFGLAYAQAEDNFAQVEQDFALAIGRGAEIYGTELLDEDRLNRALEIEQFAKSDYDTHDPKMRSLCEAFAAGINFYLQHHPNVQPKLLARIEPWYPLAFIRYSYYQNGFARDPKLGRSPLLTSWNGSPDFHNGSNGWVIAPSRSATGHAMLFINPHLPFFGPGQVYEAHIHSDEGWDFTGYARFGFPFPYIGHNLNIGWMSTDNSADR